MSENATYAIIVCCLIIFGSACEIVQSNNRLEIQKLAFEQKKHCFEMGGVYSYWTNVCKYPDKVPKP